jgi:uncharacterized protein YhbP (UPF0306 family)
LSTVDRRHSKEIAKNPKVALTIKVHENTSNEDYVIGISLEGTAGLLDENEYESVAKSYQSKHGTSDAFINSVLSGENPHKFYKFVPQTAVLFDNKNFPKDPRQEWTLV